MAKQFIHGYALLIGVNENINPTWALPDVEKDVIALQNVLIHPERCVYPPDNVKVILGKDSTRQNILNGLDWLGERINAKGSGNTTAVVFYSGHGFRDSSTQPETYYLIPYDVKTEGFRSRALRAMDFSNAISDLKPQRLLVILDCCHSGGMNVKEISDYTNSAIPSKLLMPVSKGASPQEGAKGLETLTRGTGRAVLSSSQGDQVSYLRRDKKMSIFTYHLIEALTGHAQPEAGAKEVLVSDVMSYVWRKVPESTKTDWGEVQEPDYQVSGNFPVALLLGGKGITKGLSAPDPLTSIENKKFLSKTKINTGGGAYIGGNVKIKGGDFIGRDKVVHGDEVRGDKIGEISGGFYQPNMHAGVVQQAGHDMYINDQEIHNLFKPLIKIIQDNPIPNRAEALNKVEELKQELAKGKASNDSKMGKLIEGLIGLVPSAVSSIVSIFASPILGGLAGPVTKYVLGKIQGK